MKLLLKWVSMVTVVGTATAVVYVIVLPALLPRLWPEAQLPLALLVGLGLLSIALVRDTDWYLPARKRPAARAVNRAALPDEPRVPKVEPRPQVSSDRSPPSQRPPPTSQWTAPAQPRPTAATPDKSPGPRPAAPASKDESRLESLLLNNALGDRNLVERLVNYERTQFPKATRAELLQAALERLEQDNLRG